MEHGQCTLCGERGHVASGCPDLVSPLKEGFQGGGGRGGGHSHDDEESAKIDASNKNISV